MTENKNLWQRFLDLFRKKEPVDTRPVEFRYHNPLELKIGGSVAFDHIPDLLGCNLIVKKIISYETVIGRQKFNHTDYLLQGLVDNDRVIYRLRVLADDRFEKGFQIILLFLDQSFGYSETFTEFLKDTSMELWQDNPDGSQRTYWRIDDVFNPYTATCTEISDIDKNGVIDQSEVETYEVTYWDYHRNTIDSNDQPLHEFLFVERQESSGWYDIYRGSEIRWFQIMAI